MKDEIRRKVDETKCSTRAKEELYKVILKHKDVFRKQSGRWNLFTYEIKVNTDQAIVKKPYPIPLCYRDKVRAQIRVWLELGVIEPAVTPHHTIIGDRSQKGHGRYTHLP